MSSSLPAELAATVQAAHIRTDPDPDLDIAPSTAAEKRIPVALESSRYSDLSDALADDVEDDDDDEIPYSVLRPTPRKHNLPPLPDLRFEQSYLHSIANADTWWKVVLITTRDQVMVSPNDLDGPL
ncbi:Bordetella pertussis toxin A [Purpureocillium lavendulum]|uniref:Bordetella pertussis toxin A n=1 Tax=Purpureocillium lavendulum TaxID=1247861 RepID=A0AB34G5E1_9HYPO|nr:Bordetella pertussis toxin A [Purpureocillium lavendulum]